MLSSCSTDCSLYLNSWPWITMAILLVLCFTSDSALIKLLHFIVILESNTKKKKIYYKIKLIALLVLCVQRTKHITKKTKKKTSQTRAARPNILQLKHRGIPAFCTKNNHPNTKNNMATNGRITNKFKYCAMLASRYLSKKLSSITYKNALHKI